MNIIERLISGYPQGDVSPQDFIDHLSMGADGWVGACVAEVRPFPVVHATLHRRGHLGGYGDLLPLAGMHL